MMNYSGTGKLILMNVIQARYEKLLWLDSSGQYKEYELFEVEKNSLLDKLSEPILLCHCPIVAKRLKSCLDGLPILDILELFAFVYPANFCVPSIQGVASFLGEPIPYGYEEELLSLLKSCEILLDRFKHNCRKKDIFLLKEMYKVDWLWAEVILTYLGIDGNKNKPITESSLRNLKSWHSLKEWEDVRRVNIDSYKGIDQDGAVENLTKVLGSVSEIRKQQDDYCKFVSKAFSDNDVGADNNIVTVQASTGIGKTIAYLAAASLWADKNEQPVWISTYSKNLQRQLYKELDKIYPDPNVKKANVAIRKGRENYVCILNYEQDLDRIRNNQALFVGYALFSRWLEASFDGDVKSGDFPTWLNELFFNIGRRLADRRGECIYSACSHYRRCFIEKSKIKAKRAKIVVANHSLCLLNSLKLGTELAPDYYIFDEAHHLFDTSDSVFSSHLCATETYELRRWILGAGGKKNTSRNKGILKKIEDLEMNSELESLSRDIVNNAQFLTASNWRYRILKNDNPINCCENFLWAIRQQVEARSAKNNSAYSIETDIFPAIAETLESGKELKAEIQELLKSVDLFITKLTNFLDEHLDEIDGNTTVRLEALKSSLLLRVKHPLNEWTEMLTSFLETQKNELFIDWFAIVKHEGHSLNVGFFRHYLDPAKLFAETILDGSLGAVLTSATLSDNEPQHAINEESSSGIMYLNILPDKDKVMDDSFSVNEAASTHLSVNEAEANSQKLVSDPWESTKKRLGLNYLKSSRVFLNNYSSNFDYKKQSKVIIIENVDKNNIKQVSRAYLSLFKASRGGGLGIFTAISRLRQVYELIASDLEEAHIDLFAQHVDDMDISSIIEVFKMNNNSCLLGTDAVRDGIDIPGDSLRLLIFDKIPWLRSNILNRARKKEWKQFFLKERDNNIDYDKYIARFRLKQGFGRLIRASEDRGIFVCLDNRFSKSFLSAFPSESEVIKSDLKTACQEIRKFFAENDKSVRELSEDYVNFNDSKLLQKYLSKPDEFNDVSF